MPRYFFHVEDGQSLVDHEGTVLESDGAARQQAIISAADILKDQSDRLWADEQPWVMTVTDEGGNSLFAIRFSAHEQRNRGARWPSGPPIAGATRSSARISTDDSPAPDTSG